MPTSNAAEKRTNFFQDVYEVVKLIPPGRVTSYGAIAAYLGSKGSARMVGWALIASHDQNGVSSLPGYRVVNRNGLLTGKQHFESPNAMQEYLEREGVQVKDGQVVNFEKHFWDPAKELL
ncbi:MGMT family protein [Rufibacter tibetensis]|uniref:Cysteine methyltransferase n=1 Tax=Rufibacter tibetensis TaxID=512763 RepID=A0A0P0CUA8_9BACT|nr:MGMT family protein [Rufibacter tibetensis]ALJ01136.1 cysteine methyltransferase [Rufibacter tibetensis]